MKTTAVDIHTMAEKRLACRGSHLGAVRGHDDASMAVHADQRQGPQEDDAGNELQHRSRESKSPQIQSDCVYNSHLCINAKKCISFVQV
jgi:hypothetical protein